MNLVWGRYLTKKFLLQHLNACRWLSSAVRARPSLRLFTQAAAGGFHLQRNHVKHLIDQAEDFLAQPVWHHTQPVRTLAADIHREIEAIAGEGDEGNTPLIETLTGLSTALLTRYKQEQQRLQLEGVAASRGEWQSLSDPAKRLLRGTQGGSADLSPMQPHRPGAHPRSYASLFGPVQPSGFASAADFFAIVGNAQHHPALISAAALGEQGVGGLLVPVEYEARMIDAALHQAIVLPRAAIEPMRSRTKLVSGLDGQNQGDPLSPFGMSFKWLVENQDETPGSAAVRAIELCARPLGCYVQASNEIYADAGQLETLLTDGMAQGLAEAMDHYFLRGSGAGVPLGCLHSPALLTLAKVGGQTAGTIVLQNILDILARHASPGTAVWVVSPSVLPSLFQQVIVVGAGGSHVPLVTLAPGQNGQQQMYMLGRPIYASHRMPTLGTTGDIGLYAFEYYYVGLRQGAAIERSAHAGFTANAQVWRVVARFDGQPRISKPMLGADGQQYSPFCVVETHS